MEERGWWRGEHGEERAMCGAHVGEAVVFQLQSLGDFPGSSTVCFIRDVKAFRRVVFEAGHMMEEVELLEFGRCQPNLRIIASTPQRRDSESRTVVNKWWQNWE
jgi:hypothetical protein